MVKAKTGHERASTRIDRTAYAIPFGRYVGSSQVGQGADEVLVGRQSQRAYFIDLLISAGRQGAFLVTGHRGAGKTSFVRHCIEEYQAFVLKRFLRNNDVGRAFWDRLLVLLVWLVFLLGGLLLSEASQLLVPIASEAGRHRLLVWLTIVPIAIALLYPCIYARSVAAAVFRSFDRPQKSRGTRHESWTAAACVAVWSLVVWCAVPSGSPAWTASAMFLVLGALYLLVQALSFVRVDGEPRSRWRRLGVAALRTFFGLLLAGGVYMTLHDSRLVAYDGGPWLRMNLAAGLITIATGLLLRARYQREDTTRQLERQAPHRTTDRQDRVAQAMRRGATNYFGPALATALVAGLVLCVPDLPSQWGPNLPSRWGGVLFLTLASLTLFLSSRCIWNPAPSSWAQPYNRFKPRPRWILAAAGMASVVLSLQVAYPVLQPAVRPAVLALADSPVLSTWSAGPFVKEKTEVKRKWERRSASLAQVPELDGTPRSWSPFDERLEEIGWLLSVLLLLILLYFIEYEWVMRPHVQAREDSPLDPQDRSPWDDRDELDDDSVHPDDTTASKRPWREHRELAELTLPWTVYRIWLPTIPVRVNLGFDSKLGAVQIIQAMLVGLRSAYQRTFTAWNSGLANMGRFAGILFLLTAVTLAGDLWFGLPTASRMQELLEENGSSVARTPPGVTGADPLCDLMEKTRGQRSFKIPDLICYFGDGWLTTLYLDLLPTRVADLSGDRQKDDLLLYVLLPFPSEAEADRADLDCAVTPALCQWERLVPYGLHFRVYHLLLFLAFLYAGRWMIRRVPLLPYSSNLRRIEDLLDGMSAHTRVVHRPTIWQPARWIYSLVSDRVREMEREPFDLRTVEQAFLEILEEIQRGGLRMPALASRHLSIPAPEITFIFDELDKLGSRLDPESEDLSALASKIRAHQAEQERALKLRALLSDLKNVLSSAAARFIFIGGRNLHDEWLADQTARLPLLTNVFIAEVYVPSLMTDYSTRENDDACLHGRFEEFLVCQHRRAEHLFQAWALKRWRPSFMMATDLLCPERFATGDSETADGLERLRESMVIVDRAERSRQAGGVSAWCTRDEREALIEDLVRFLAHRSLGNPKRLKELLNSFIRPVAQIVTTGQRWRDFPCRHVLYFDDVALFRLQLISSVYRQLAATFEPRILHRDDKVATSIFFLSDFLFKFHRRAFSWGNLERVDELAHIHRAPDMRDIQEEMVDLVSERYLHRILNGMYSFRFRSDVAREVELLSRNSPEEMAALNFTLDESQSLKALYHHALEHREEPNPGLVAGLGELYEFDQEYETARHYYRRAIDILDTVMIAKTADKGSIDDLLNGKPGGLQHARVHLAWGEARLRLMLQVGMTFELTRNLEHAIVEYRTARTLARALVRAWLSLDPDEDDEDRDDGVDTVMRLVSEDWEPDRSRRRGPFNVVKHLGIVFQPLFAEAWVAEKMIGAVDTSVSMLESGLWQTRRLMPFTKQPKVVATKGTVTASQSNFCLTLSQLHNKAGDVHFFKGRQPVTWEMMTNPQTWKHSATDRTTDGYLLRAHYHYAVSLHDIRRYTYHRVASSEHRFSLSKTRSRTLLAEMLPDFLCRAVAGGVADMGEATLARVSLFGLLRELMTERSPRRKKNVVTPPDFEAELLRWLGCDDEEARKTGHLMLELGPDADPRERVDLRTLSSCLGEWVARERRPYREMGDDGVLLRFTGPATAPARLVVSLSLCRVGAEFFARGGYPEDAGREQLQLCEVTLRLLWWIRAVVALDDWVSEKDSHESGAGEEGVSESRKKVERALSQLWDAVLTKTQLGPGRLAAFLAAHYRFAVESLYRADRSFRQSRLKQLERPDGSARQIVGDVIPPDAVTVALSLSLWHEGLVRHLGTSTRWSGLAEQFLKSPVREAARKRFDELLEHWLGDRPPETDVPRETRRGYSRRHLEALLRRHRYPMLNRLNGLRTLVEDSVLNGSTEFELQRASDLLAELLDLNQRYDAPLHFTPIDTGVTCALHWLRMSCRKSTKDRPIDHEDERRLDHFRRTAQHHLQVGEEMYSLRRAFYEVISDLYYLYDDFNDRQIHSKQALQMASAELGTLLRHLLEDGG